MKQQDYLLTERYAKLYDLSNNGRIDANKIRLFINSCPDVVRVFTLFLREADTQEIKEGDAVESSDGKKKLVVFVRWEHVENKDTKTVETKAVDAFLKDLEGNTGYEPLSKLRRLK